LANNVGVSGVSDLPNLSARMRARNQNQMAAIGFAPATYIAIAQFNEINGPVKLVLPAAGRFDLFLTGINLHELPRRSEGRWIWTISPIA
jgi:hypothetical protein